MGAAPPGLLGAFLLGGRCLAGEACDRRVVESLLLFEPGEVAGALGPGARQRGALGRRIVDDLVERRLALLQRLQGPLGAARSPYLVEDRDVLVGDMAEPVEGRERVVERFCTEEDGERVDLAAFDVQGLEAPREPRSAARRLLRATAS